MHTREIEIVTGNRRRLADITAECVAFVGEVADERDGLLHLFVPHATAGLVVMELGSGSDYDLLDTLDRLLPRDTRWRHAHDSPGHGADHVLPLLAPPALSLPVIGGSLALGTWQSVAVLDTNADNPTRRVRLSFLPG